jgi:hypothetical protein
MKKEFVKPVLTRYDLNSKENIVASISPVFEDTYLMARWSFTSNINEAGVAVNPNLPNQGCFMYFYGDDTEDIVAAGYLNADYSWYDFLSHISDPTSPKIDVYDRCAQKVHS